MCIPQRIVSAQIDLFLRARRGGAGHCYAFAIADLRARRRSAFDFTGIDHPDSKADSGK
jgi:hypothetical protein